MSVIEEEKRCNNGIRKPTCANAFRASWAEQGGIILWGGGGVGWRDRLGQLGWTLGKESKMELILNFKGIWNLARHWEIPQGDLEGI
jgi:hypothetical protein